MLDLKFIRKNPDLVKEAVKNKGEDVDIHKILELDEKRRIIIKDLDEERNRLNVISKEISKLIKEGRKPDIEKEKAKEISEKVKDLEKKLREIEEELKSLLLKVPNIPHSTVPVGDSSKNKIIRTWGKKPEFSFQPLDHIKIAQNLDIIDFERAAKICGSNFVLFKGWGARLERALYNFMLDLHIRKHKYTEVFPPFLVNRKSMIGTGQLPKLEEDMYRLKDDDYFLIPTAEVPVTNIHREEILDESQLPIYYVSYTACFRREAGSYGKETKGLVRVHQFDKVELVKIVKPQDSYEELERLVNDAEEVLKLLGLHYRVVLLASQELSFAASKCYDLECWAPGLQRWLEVSSCSNFEDFQARRMGMRLRTKDKKLTYPHTLNGSGLALARLVICILETYQNKDGSVTVPQVLRPYLDNIERIEPSKF